MLADKEIMLNFAAQKAERPAQGTMSEWLGNGLQNRSHQFESGWYLGPQESANALCMSGFFLFQRRTMRLRTLLIPS